MTFYTITENDINSFCIRCFGKDWPVSSFIGRILPSDIEKRVYLVNDILQVENDEQRNKRLTNR